MRDIDFLIMQIEAAIEERNMKQRGVKCDLCNLQDSHLINGLCNVCNQKYRPINEQSD